jgi:prenyltransferase beta subunit
MALQVNKFDHALLVKNSLDNYIHKMFVKRLESIVKLQQNSNLNEIGYDQCPYQVKRQATSKLTKYEAD